MSTSTMNRSSSKSDSKSDSMNDSITSTSSSTSSQNRLITEPILYKTKMCRNFMRDGYCVYETKCMFAHGTFDVRDVDRNVKEGLTSEEKVKRFQTRSIIMLKQKTRKEQPPSFQDALVQVAENDKPRFATSSVVSPIASVSTEPTSVQMKNTPPPQEMASDSIIDIILDEPDHTTPQKSAEHEMQSSITGSESTTSQRVRQHQPYAATPTHAPHHSYDGYYYGYNSYGYGYQPPAATYGSYCDCPTCNAQRIATPTCSCHDCVSNASMTSYSNATSPSGSMSQYPAQVV